MKFKGIFENIFGKKEEIEEEIQPITEKAKEEIQSIKEEVKEKIVEEKNKNLTQILSKNLRKTERYNIRFSKHTLNLMKEKVEKITKQNDLKNSEIINFIISYFLNGELNKEPIKILSRNTKKYKLTFQLSEEEIEYIFNSCIEKNIYIEESCFQLTRNGINKDAKNKIYQLLMSEIHGLSNTQEEKKFLENMKELREINQKIIELKNFQFYNYLSGESLGDKFEEIIKEITEMSEPIKEITKFLKKV